MSHTPWPHQKEAFSFCEFRRAAMLAMEPGCGKSKVVVDLVEARKQRRILILCPKSVVDVWRRQFSLHNPEHFPIVFPLGGKMTVVEKRREAEKAFLITEFDTAIVINYDSARMEPFASWALSQRWDLVVLDESHRIKSPTSAISKFCWSLGRKAEYRLALTGTPMPHAPLDLWSQFCFLNPAIFGKCQNFRNRFLVTVAQAIESIRTFSADVSDETILDELRHFNVDRNLVRRYRNRWVEGELGTRYEECGPPPEVFMTHQVIAYINQDALNQAFRSLAFVAKAAECLSLPPATHEARLFDMPAKTRKLYDRLAKDFYAEIGESEITSPLMLTRLLRFQQLTGGFVTDDPDAPQVEGEKRKRGEDIRLDSAKGEILCDLLQDIPNSELVTVFYNFKEDLYMILGVFEKLERKYGQVNGQGNDLIESCYPPDCNALAVQVQAGGVGIDLTRSRIAFFYSTGFLSPGEYDQILARMVRPGQERPVVFYHLMANKSVDITIEENRRNRREAIDGVLNANGLLSEWSEWDG